MENLIEHVEDEGGLSIDAFVKGEKDEAENFFKNKGKPVHCLSTRFGGVNYRVSMLIGDASACAKWPSTAPTSTTSHDGARGRVGRGAQDDDSAYPE